MSRFTKTRMKNVGQPPGTILYTGEKKTEEVKITVIEYDEKEYHEKEAGTIEECCLLKEKPTVTWINIDGLHNPDIINKIGNQFEIHPLTLEDIVNTTQRPKIDDLGHALFIVLKMLSYNEEEQRVDSEQLSIIVGSNFVLSLQEREGDVFNPIRERIQTAKGRIRKMGADYLAYALIDAIVDNYFLILEKFGEELETLEEELLENPMPKTSAKIHTLKREMIFLRRSVWPLRELINALEKSESRLIKKSTLLFLRDIYDNTLQIIDTVETYRDMISGMLDTYLSSLSYKMNEVMKILTLIATIFIPLTFLAGIYGMNFRYMPELEWRWGYPVVWIIMIALGILMFIFFKRKRWF